MWKDASCCCCCTVPRLIRFGWFPVFHPNLPFINLLWSKIHPPPLTRIPTKRKVGICCIQWIHRGLYKIFMSEDKMANPEALFLDVSMVCHDPQTGVLTDVFHGYLYLDIYIFIWYKHLNTDRQEPRTFRLPFGGRPMAASKNTAYSFNI